MALWGKKTHNGIRDSKKKAAVLNISEGWKKKQTKTKKKKFPANTDIINFIWPLAPLPGIKRWQSRDCIQNGEQEWLIKI